MKKLLSVIEYYGNKIPHPSLMFFCLCLLIVVCSGLAHSVQLQAKNPVSGEMIIVKSLLSAEGLRFMLTGMVSNFTGFAPLGIVLVAMMGIGLAEKSGLLGQLLHSLVFYAKGSMLTYSVAFIGVMSSIGSDSGYVVLIPLSALLFIAAGRSPLAGIATAFAGVSGGYSANLLIGPIDAVLSGISTEAAHIINAKVTVAATSNWYFNVISTFFIAAIITLITELKQWPEINSNESNKQEHEPSAGRLKGQLIFSIVYFTLVLLLVLPETAPLRDPVTGSIAKSPFIDSLVIIITLYFAGMGILYGYVNGTFNNAAEVIQAMEDTMRSMAGYMVLMFFAAQFIAYFNWTNLGLIIAVEGANLLAQLDMNKYLLILVFILISSAINLFIGSSSAKWALIAPVFIPMLMLLDIRPELTQLAYRIGDSSTNIITPMMPYFALVLAFAQQHDQRVGMGTLLSTMLPYSIAFISFWTWLLVCWLLMGFPIGL